MTFAKEAGPSATTGSPQGLSVRENEKRKYDSPGINILHVVVSSGREGVE